VGTQCLVNYTSWMLAPRCQYTFKRIAKVRALGAGTYLVSRHLYCHSSFLDGLSWVASQMVPGMTCQLRPELTMAMNKGQEHAIDNSSAVDVSANSSIAYTGARTAQHNFTMWLEHGAGSNYLSMAQLSDALAPDFRTCGYSRAGYAWSQASALPRTSQRIITESQQVMELVGERPPYVLVGHSFGGQLAKRLAAQRGADIAAVVLLDSVPNHHWCGPGITLILHTQELTASKCHCLHLAPLPSLLSCQSHPHA
jgi:Alpha/beta hydrolase family